MDSQRMNWIQGCMVGILCFFFLLGGTSEAGTVPNSICQASIPADHWKGEYFNNKELSGSPSMVRDDGTSSLNFDWGTGSPSTSCGLGVDSFSVRWTRTVNFGGGSYQFTVTADDGVRLWIDNQLVLDKWILQGATTYPIPISLSAGNHTLKMEYFENTGGAVAKLSWQEVSPPPPPPTCQASVPAENWKGEYFNNKELSGSPSMVRDDGTSSLNFDWGNGSPSTSCGIGADSFSVRWTRTVNFSGGSYQFSVTADDGVRLWIDNQLVLDKWILQGATTYPIPISLSAGNHTLKMEYFENTGAAVAQVSWKEVAPSQFVITATAGTGGTINPLGEIRVNSGADQIFTIAPETGFQIADVKVDGTSKGAINSYTFPTVTSNHTIDASFAPLVNGFVTVSGKNFYLNGQIWKPYGVHYFPSYLKYVPMSWNSDDWLESEYYNRYKDSIDRELADIQNLGANTIGIFGIRNPANCSSLNDFLEKATSHNLKVQYFLMGADPFIYRYEEEKDIPNYIRIIQDCNLANNPTIYTYDITGEPHLGNQVGVDVNSSRDYYLPWWVGPTTIFSKKTIRDEWNDWILENYGSYTNAYQAWSYTPFESTIFDYDAVWQEVSFPAKVEPNTNFNLYAKFKNKGKLTWDAKKNYNQKAIGIFFFNTAAKVTTEHWFNFFASGTEEISFGQSKEFNLVVQAPPDQGEYEIGIQLLLLEQTDGKPGWFGDLFTSKIIVSSVSASSPIAFSRGGFLYGPTDNELCQRGDANKMVIAYKRFLDQYINSKIAKVATRIREVDPNRLLNGHSGYAGNGSEYICPQYPLDARYHFQSLDFTTVEYPIYNPDLQGKETGFNVSYNKINKPVVIAEYGRDLWQECKNPSAPCPVSCSEQQIINGKEKQASVYQKTYEMAKDFGAAGLVSWWYTGKRGCGLRTGQPDPEVSNYGIVEPDTLDHYPAYNVFKNNALGFYNNIPPVPNEVITIDRDDFLADYLLYNEGQARFKQTLNRGKIPEVKSSCEGKTSDDGGLFDIAGLPKCLDAVFESLEIQNRNGVWERVRNLDRIEIPAKNSFKIRGRVRNIREGKWWSENEQGRSGSFAGNVYLGGHDPTDQISFRTRIPKTTLFTEAIEIPETTVYLNQELSTSIKMTIKMVSEYHYWFGEGITVTILPP
jgi:hypothetical protein